MTQEAKQMKLAQHKERMAKRRASQNARRADCKTPIYANVGREHPDYGYTPKEHIARKAQRGAAQ